MTEPLGEVDLAELDAVEPPRAEKEPFLHSVTRQTPWCLYSVMFHVLIVVLIGLVPIIAANSGDHEQVLVLIDPGPPAETEFYGGSTHAVPLGTASPGDPAAASPVDIAPDGTPPDIFESSDHIIQEDIRVPEPVTASLPAEATLGTIDPDEHPLPLISGTGGGGALPASGLRNRIHELFKASVAALRAQIPAWIGHSAAK